MDTERGEDSKIELALPDPVHEWVGETAEALEIDEETAIRRLLIASHAVSTADGGSDSDAGADSELDGSGSGIGVSEELIDRLANVDLELEEEIDTLRSQYRRDLEDVRDRVIQLKREIDAKAPAEHRHDGVARQQAELDRRLKELEATLETAIEDVDAIQDRVDGGFENFRTVLERLIDRSDTIEGQLDTVAEMHLTLRDDVDRLVPFAEEQERLVKLTGAANRQGIRTAKCEECDMTIDIGLLTTPRCPSCSNRFAELVPKQGFFGTNRLRIEQPPALETGSDEGNHRTPSGETDGGSFNWISDT